MLTKLERKKNNVHLLLSPTPLNCHFPISDLNALTLASSVFTATIRTQLLFIFLFLFSLSSLYSFVINLFFAC